jgi:hypothetical protein
MTGNAATFMGVLVSTGFLMVVKALEVIYGGLILANIQRPLAAVLLAPISVCILFRTYAVGYATALILADLTSCFKKGVYCSFLT